MANKFLAITISTVVAILLVVIIQSLNIFSSPVVGFGASSVVWISIYTALSKQKK